jgi:primosomal protein N'
MQAKNKSKLEIAAKELAEKLKGVTVLGPAEPLVSKAQKNHRLCITIKSANSADIKNALKDIKIKGIEIRIDRDC